jgi:C4-dicarboxylate-specific signal transduction histidine kinase
LRSFLPPLPETAVFCVVVLAALWLIARTESADGFKLFYLLFLPVVVAAVRRGLDGATLSLAVTQLALVGLLIRHGHEAKGFTEFQILMCVLTATGLIVGIAVSERREADRRARAAAALLQEKENEIAHAARFSLVSGMTSALAHEINQPMAAARALARSAQELLRQPQADVARAERNLATALAEIDLASGIVRRMREFIRRGRPHVSTIDVATLLDETLTLIRPDAARKNVRIDVDVAPDASPVHGDRIQLQQVALNLVRNAIDSLAGAHRPDGAIRITARCDGSHNNIEIGVIDDGPGIAPELAEKLFQPLTTSKKEGLGLGLSISLAIVEAHGGRIWLQSGKPGATEFRFSLPLEPPHLP